MRGSHGIAHDIENRCRLHTLVVPAQSRFRLRFHARMYVERQPPYLKTPPGDIFTAGSHVCYLVIPPSVPPWRPGMRTGVPMQALRARVFLAPDKREKTSAIRPGKRKGRRVTVRNPERFRPYTGTRPGRGGLRRLRGCPSKGCTCA